MEVVRGGVREQEVDRWQWLGFFSSVVLIQCHWEQEVVLGYKQSIM